MNILEGEAAIEKGFLPQIGKIINSSFHAPIIPVQQFKDYGHNKVSK
jgi:hypothetical protein